jgi:DNA/RNA-binding domain of Phe-tRNA-synthetase-like protein
MIREWNRAKPVLSLGMTISVDAHPLLALAALQADFAKPLGTAPSPTWLSEGLRPTFQAPLACTAETRKAVRNMLRAGGFKPKGRSKPASEYLARAAQENALATINPAVDACNVVSLHSGLPISIVDRSLLTPPLRVAVAAAGDAYVFNQAGQTIDVGGLLCLHDARGPCANAVKDAQRTKTCAETLRTLILIWGAVQLANHTTQAALWCRRLLQRLGAAVQPIPMS